MHMFWDVSYAELGFFSSDNVWTYCMYYNQISIVKQLYVITLFNYTREIEGLH